jgi:nicotinate-nucleotide pyrophosphorylase (carboxylating)
MPQLPPDLDATIRRALEEDVGAGDVTTNAVVPADASARGRFRARHEGVIAGVEVARRVFELVGAIEWEDIAVDGDEVVGGRPIAAVLGPARTLLTAERVALNFLTHLSGIATATRAFVDACVGTDSTVLCTRKTLPGLRALERYAVEVGGGALHRAGLYDAVLVKDNHVAVAGGVGEAIRRARAAGMPIEVEVDTLDQLREAIDAGADSILLDNPDAATVRRAVELTAGRVPLEISGGMTVEKVREIAGLGKLLISVGRITHSAPALDISLDVEALP